MESGRSFWHRMDKLFRAIGLTTPSVRAVARELAFAPEGLSVGALAARCDLSRASVRNAAKRLSRLHLRGYSLCLVHRPRYRGRGYETILQCEAFTVSKRRSAGNETPKTRGIRHTQTSGDVPCARPRQQDPTPDRKTPDEQQAIVAALPDDLVLVRGARYWRYVMANCRRGCWLLGASRAVSDIVTGTVAKRVTGVALREYRRIASVLARSGRDLMQRVRVALKRGRRAAYAACEAILNRLLAGQPVRDRQPAGQGTESRIRDGGYHLGTPAGRRRYLDAARAIAAAGGGSCPRCGERIERCLLRDDAAIAFEREGLCRCVYVAFDREALSREAAWEREKRERSTRPASGEAGVRDHCRV